MLQEWNYVILDSQTVLYQDRIDLFNHLNLDNIKVIGIWVESSKQKAYHRNFQKPIEDRPSKKEMELLYKYKVSPTPEEPFDDLDYIMRDADIGMSKSYPYIASTFETLDRI